MRVNVPRPLAPGGGIWESPGNRQDNKRSEQNGRPLTASLAPLQIRAPIASDRAQWGLLWQGYLAFYETALPAEQHDRQFARLLSPDVHAFRGLVALQDGQMVGLAHYLFHAHGWQAHDTCYLQDLWTEPAARGRGVARALIAAVGAAAQAHGAAPVYWLTHAENHRARAVYDRVARATGFVEYELPLPEATA